MDQSSPHIYSVYVSKVFQNWAHICSNVQDLLPVKVCTITSQAGSNSLKPWSSLQIHKKILLLGKETLGQCGEKGRKTRNVTLGLLCWVPMSSLLSLTDPLPPIPGPRSRGGQEQIPIQSRRGKSYWVSHARNLLISQSQHCSHPVPEQNVLCPILNHHQETERSREPLYHTQPNEPDQRY